MLSGVLVDRFDVRYDLCGIRIDDGGPNRGNDARQIAVGASHEGIHQHDLLGERHRHPAWELDSRNIELGSGAELVTILANVSYYPDDVARWIVRQPESDPFSNRIVAGPECAGHVGIDNGDGSAVFGVLLAKRAPAVEWNLQCLKIRDPDRVPLCRPGLLLVLCH